MSGDLRIVDSGVRGARENLSVTAALAELHRTGECPDTLRFQHFRPSAIIGRHQQLGREVDVDACAARGVEIARRMTGGGAIYMGPGLLGWELIVRRSCVPGPLDEISRTLCEGLARGLTGLGVAARYRPRNDVEVDGRKVSGTGGFIDGRTLVFQGTVLIDFDIADMAAVLRLPIDKLDRKGLAVLGERVTSLSALVGRTPGCEVVKDAVTSGLAGAIAARSRPGGLSQAEERLAGLMLADEIGRDAFVVGEAIGSAADVTARCGTTGGQIETLVRLRSGSGDVIERVWIIGDFFAAPPRVIPDLEAALSGMPLAEAASRAQTLLESSGAEFLGAQRSDIVHLLAECHRASNAK